MNVMSVSIESFLDPVRLCNILVFLQSIQAKAQEKSFKSVSLSALKPGQAVRVRRQPYRTVLKWSSVWCAATYDGFLCVQVHVAWSSSVEYVHVAWIQVISAVRGAAVVWGHRSSVVVQGGVGHV